MRGDVTFRVVGVSADGSRFVVGERFWHAQAELLRRHVVVSNKFPQILVEPDSGEQRRKQRLAGCLGGFLSRLFGQSTCRPCLELS